MRPAPSSVRAWLQLLRPPNLFTVVGDPLAGYCLVRAATPATAFDWRAAGCTALAALFLYAGGLIANDVADYAEDLRDRPKRPLPSGRVRRGHAFAAAALCALVGLLLALAAGTAAFVAACLTQCAIMAYNGGLKHRAIPGALAMGACRGGSLLIGTAAAGLCSAPAAVWPVAAAAAGLTVYIAGVTWIADRETIATRIGFRRWIPLAALLVAWPLVGLGLNRVAWPFMLLGAGAAAWAAYVGWRLRGIPPRPVLGASIGGLIRGLLLIQAGFAALAGTPGLATAAALLALWPLSKAAARRFYAT